jgi:hypothetical protein
MGIDATKPVSTEPMAFKHIHVKGVENVDLGRMPQRDPKAAFARMIASQDEARARKSTPAQRSGTRKGNGKNVFQEELPCRQR